MKIRRIVVSATIATIATLMLAHLPVYAASFDCNKGRSLTEKMICHDPALSKLDDTLGQLYGKARRQSINRRAFLIDSDSKWAWREANCRDQTCLGTWYATRIDELQRLIDSMNTGARTVPVPPFVPSVPEAPHGLPLPTPQATQSPQAALLQCTAAHPGIAVHDQCSTVIRQNSRWEYEAHGGDWFCGIAMLAPVDVATAQ